MFSERLSVTLPPDFAEYVRCEAAKRGETVAAFFRESLFTALGFQITESAKSADDLVEKAVTLSRFLECFDSDSRENLTRMMNAAMLRSLAAMGGEPDDTVRVCEALNAAVTAMREAEVQRLMAEGYKEWAAQDRDIAEEFMPIAEETWPVD